jgi:manganese/zinc/iron transport system substrate-binding protein
VQGLSTESEAGLRDLEATVAMLVERKIPAVFVESTVSPRTVQALVDGARARGHEVRIGGTLFSDSTGPIGSGAETWAGMLRANARTIVEALAKETIDGR